MRKVLVVDDGFNTAKVAALGLALEKAQDVISDEHVFYIRANESYEYPKQILKAKKTYLNLGKKDRFQR
jgi:hypothetical protein